MEICSVTSKGQVTIPKTIRQQLGIRQGSKVSFNIDSNGMVSLQVSSTQPVETNSGFGMLKSRKQSISADFDPADLLK